MSSDDRNPGASTFPLHVSADEEDGADDKVAALVMAALCPSESQDLAGLLKSISEQQSTYGCVLWEMASQTRRAGDPPGGHLFALASFFPDDRCGGQFACHDLPVEGSLAGEVVRAQAPGFVNDIAGSGLGEREVRYFAQQGVNSVCSYPVKFLDGNRGALSVYRRDPERFQAADTRNLRWPAALVPSLYQAIRDRMSFNLIRRVNQRLNEAESRSSGRLLTKDEKKTVLKNVCRQVADSFRCHEVSLFLNDPIDRPLSFDLMATTLTRALNRKSYANDPKGALTGWVIHHASPVRIFDLGNWEKDKERIRKDYPGLDWSDSHDIANLTRYLFDLVNRDDLPPMSVMSMPILDDKGKAAIGVIRCSIATGCGPYYFAERDAELLSLVAIQIGQCWQAWLRRREIEEENRSWGNFVEGIGQLNEFVGKEVEENALNERTFERNVYRRSLELAARAIKDAELIAVRTVEQGARG